MAQLVTSSIIQAGAFVGMQWLFSKLDHKGYAKEMARHNKALEQLSAARERFFENETKRKDRIADLEKQKRDPMLTLNTPTNFSKSSSNSDRNKRRPKCPPS